VLAYFPSAIFAKQNHNGTVNYFTITTADLHKHHKATQKVL
jgi:hypothetical protein